MSASIALRLDFDALQLRGLARKTKGYVFAAPLPGSPFLQLVEAIDPLNAAGEEAGEPAASETAFGGRTGHCADGPHAAAAGQIDPTRGFS